jgi:chemotaxis protein histidine kinase CheA
MSVDELLVWVKTKSTAKSCWLWQNGVMNLAAFMGEFKAEAYDHLEKLDQGLLQLERDPSNNQLIRGLFLSMHTIKGGASMLELKALKHLTHAFEDVLARLRDHGEACDSHTATLLLKAVDMVREIVDTDPSMETMSPAVEDMTNKLRQRASGVIVTLEPSASMSGIQASLADLDPPIETKVATKSNLVLLLEPSETARNVMTTQLESAGWTVAGFASAHEIQNRVSEAGLLVLPLEPSGGIDGLALAREWRTFGTKTPIVITALEFSPVQETDAKTLGVACAPKPSWRDSHLTELARSLV